MAVYPEADERTIEWCRRFDGLKGDRAVWDTLWQDISDYILPHRGGIQRQIYTPQNSDSYLFDTSAGDMLRRACAGFLNWTTPSVTPWFEFSPIMAQEDSDVVKQWLKRCSFIAIKQLSESNFYTVRQQALMDLWQFGTSAYFSQVTDDQRVYFEHVKLGSYVFDVDQYGAVDTFMRDDIDLTARVAAQKFGEEELPKCIKDCLSGPNPQPDRKFRFLHVVEPRPRKDRGEGFTSAKRKPFVSAYIEVSTKKLVQEGGYETFPFHVGRFEPWTSFGVKTVWGWGPGVSILPEARQLNFLQKMMDAMMEKKVFPPIMAPVSTRGTLRPIARGINYYPDGMREQIYPLDIVGDPEVGVQRLEIRRKAIEMKCYLDMFQMFSQLASQKYDMTAYQASLLAGEKLDAISSAFASDTKESIQPMVLRLFDGLAEMGMFPEPPPEAIQAYGRNQVIVPPPEVTMTSRLAMAIGRLSLRDAEMQVERLVALSQFIPGILDNINGDYLAREGLRQAGADPKVLRPESEVAQMRLAQQQAQQATMAMEAMQAGAKSIRDVGGVPQAKELMAEVA